MATIDELYSCYEQLDNAESKEDKKDAYRTILDGVKGGTNEKRLASQLITRFVKYFPELREDALNALLDLCEDYDISIRKQAIRDLPTLCRECPVYTQRIADILTQLLQVQDPTEIRLVEHSLMQLARHDARETFAGILNQFDTTTDSIIRSRAAHFIGIRVKELAESGILSAQVTNQQQQTVPDCESYLAARINQTMLHRKQLLEGDEFVAFMKALSALRTMQTVSGRQQLVALACQQVTATVPFGAECDTEQLDKLFTCCKLMMPLLSRNVPADDMIEYMCTRVLPRFDAIPTALQSQRTHTISQLDSNLSGSDASEAQHAANTSDSRLEVLKVLAEVCAFAGGFQPVRAAEIVTNLLAVVFRYLPSVPSGATPDCSHLPAFVDDLQFSHLECCLFAVHQLARFLDLTSANSNAKTDVNFDVDAFRELQKRLQLVGRRVQQLRTKLNEALRYRMSAPRGIVASATASTCKSGLQLATGTQTHTSTSTPTSASGQAEMATKKELKEAALRTLGNIFLLIRDLLHYPPHCKATITLSWMPVSVAQPATLNKSQPLSTPKSNTSGTHYSASAKTTSASKRPAENALPLPTTGTPTAVASKQSRMAKQLRQGVYQPPSARFQLATVHHNADGNNVTNRPGDQRAALNRTRPRYSMGGRGRAGRWRGASRGGRY